MQVMQHVENNDLTLFYIIGSISLAFSITIATVETNKLLDFVH